MFWSPDFDGEISPLGPLAADAAAEGYGKGRRTPATNRNRSTDTSSRFSRARANTRPGGKYDYVINGNMIGGFALVAWPAEYGETGVMTFIVNQQGRVYQKDLGPQTAKTAGEMKSIRSGQDLDGLTRLNRLLATDHRLLITDY